MNLWTIIGSSRDLINEIEPTSINFTLGISIYLLGVSYSLLLFCFSVKIKSSMWFYFDLYWGNIYLCLFYRVCNLIAKNVHKFVLLDMLLYIPYRTEWPTIINLIYTFIKLTYYAETKIKSVDMSTKSTRALVCFWISKKLYIGSRLGFSSKLDVPRQHIFLRLG